MQRVKETTTQLELKADVRPQRQLNRPLWLSLAVMMSVSIAICLVIMISLITYLASAAYPISRAMFKEAIPNPNTQTTNALDVLEFCSGTSDTCAVRTIQLAEGIFTEIWAVRTSTYSRVEYAVRHDTLKVGDLVAIWGEPDMNPIGNSLKLYWDNGLVFAEATSPTRQYSYFLPVTRVIIVDIF